MIKELEVPENNASSLKMADRSEFLPKRLVQSLLDPDSRRKKRLALPSKLPPSSRYFSSKTTALWATKPMPDYVY